MRTHNPIIVALDVPTVYEARRLVEDLYECVGGFKLGLEFITNQIVTLATASDAVHLLMELRELMEELQETNIMWDNKFHDISNTMAGAVGGLLPLNPWAFTVHASTGEKALQQAVANRGASKALGVTVLTSLSEEETQEIYGARPDMKVLQFAQMLLYNRADGIVCSPQELMMLGRHPELRSLIKVVPGIRPLWAQPVDQTRVMTPAEAMKADATYLVIGRPITNPPATIGSPVEAVNRILEEIHA